MEFNNFMNQLIISLIDLTRKKMQNKCRNHVIKNNLQMKQFDVLREEHGSVTSRPFRH